MGSSPPGTSGTGTGYDQENASLLPPAAHEPEGLSEVAE